MLFRLNKKKLLFIFENRTGCHKQAIETVSLSGLSSLVFKSFTKTMRTEPAVHQRATERLNTRVKA
jgi:hypothetical protein